MKLSEVKIKGFRNFKDATINFNAKTLIIGANDIGKTNLIYALRLLLDKSLSEYDIEPKDSDFYAYEETNEFSILLRFEEVTEDCIVAKMKGKISDKDELYILYEGFRDVITNAKSYKISTGSKIDTLEESEERYYRKVLNLKYISSRRDFWGYINREKTNLLQIAKNNRTDETKAKDDTLYNEIVDGLQLIDKKVPQLSYIADATKSINTELQKLSIHHKSQNIVFDASSSNVENFINNISVASKHSDKTLLVGGDGRLNQIYLSLWAARNEIAEDNIQEVSLICIEEPEAYLHPHQQRKLAEYLGLTIKGQVILTSHSPQIASEFSPNSVVRLTDKGDGAYAASNGCSKIIDDAFDDFGYRMSIIPAEAFFADCILLVEGQSEMLFYKTLSKQLEIDLDRLNISILSVEGVGFSSFIKILDALEIDWILRTDNDIIKIPKKNEYRFAGVQRGVSCMKQSLQNEKSTDAILLANESLLKGFNTATPPKTNIDAAQKIINELKRYGIFLAKKDLENDLFNSSLKSSLTTYFKKKNIEENEVIKAMQERKASQMYSYLKTSKDDLICLKNDEISAPLILCQDIIKKIQNGAD